MVPSAIFSIYKCIEAHDLEKKAQDDFQTLCFEFGLELDDVV
jgi:hypothetical protein